MTSYAPNMQGPLHGFTLVCMEHVAMGWTEQKRSLFAGSIDCNRHVTLPHRTSTPSFTWKPNSNDVTLG